MRLRLVGRTVGWPGRSPSGLRTLVRLAAMGILTVVIGLVVVAALLAVLSGSVALFL